MRTVARALDAVVLRVGPNALALGYARPGMRHDIPPPLVAEARRVLEAAVHDPEAMRELRRFRRPHGTSPLSDRALVHALLAAVAAGEVEAAAVPSMRLRPAENRAADRGRAIARAAFRLDAPTSAPRTPAPPSASSVAGWPLQRRLKEVLARTARKLPRHLLAAFSALFSDENLLLIAASAVLLEAANLTPVGWLADAAVAGIAMYYGGLAGLAAIKDVIVFAERLVRARTEADLDAAADALAAAVVGLGAVGLLALLHTRGRASAAGASEDRAVTRAKGVDGGKVAPKPKPTTPARESPSAAGTQTYWPPNDGFAGAPADETLQPGTRVDRYGFDSGRYLAPEGTPDAMRSLEPGTTSKPYNIYEVSKPLDVQSGPAAPWFNQIGGGTQYKLPMSVGDAMSQGYLKKVGP